MYKNSQKSMEQVFNTSMLLATTLVVGVLYASRLIARHKELQMGILYALGRMVTVEDERYDQFILPIYRMYAYYLLIYIIVVISKFI